MKKYLPHLAFIIAVSLIGIAYDSLELKAYDDDSIVLSVISFLIIFFLWKNNYFTRNK